MRHTSVDYERAISDLMPRECESLTDLLCEILPPQWRRAYRKMAQTPTNICRFSDHGLTIMFDHSSELVGRGVLSEERAVEDRIVVAFGRTSVASSRPNDVETRGLLGPFSGMLGGNTGEERMMGRALGGGRTLNLFPLRRDLARERSADGRTFRAMERYCAEHPGMFCFSRPIYDSRSWWPSAIEHGVLRSDRTLWVRQFENRGEGSRIPSLVSRLTHPLPGRAAEQ